MPIRARKPPDTEACVHARIRAHVLQPALLVSRSSTNLWENWMNGSVLILTLVNLALANAIVWFVVAMGGP